MRTNAHILIDQTLMPGRPPFDLELESLKTDGLILENHEHDIPPFACMEWAIPSFIFAYFTKPYFDGFLTEMGADHYRVLKEWVVKQNRKFKGFTTKTITASKSTAKIGKSKSPSNFFALYFQTPKGNRLKVFMPETESDEMDVQVLSELLDSLKKLYTKPKSKFAFKINVLTDKIYEELYAVYNVEKKDWEYYTGTMLVHKSIANNNEKKEI
jgi:hypothetical protein